MESWLVIDLEATTEEGGWPVREMEIIEIGASLVAEDGHEVDHFQRYVRPQRRPCLTSFCRQLTRISQADIDTAELMPSVWAQFEHWLHPYQPHLVGWASWGEYDRLQLEQEWHRYGLISSLSISSHINLKQRFAEARQLKRAIGLRTALHLAGLRFQGPQHRALADARNTARLLPLVLPAPGLT